MFRRRRIRVQVSGVRKDGSFRRAGGDFNIHPRMKEAVKTGLAMAYGLALQMDWEKPYWAGFAVVTTLTALSLED